MRGRDPHTRCAVLYPAIAEAARRVGSDAIGLIDVGGSTALDVDRVGITYSNGQSLGDPSAPVQLSSSVVGDRPIPTRALPEIVVRSGVDPLDVPAAFAEVPADALPVVTTTWALSQLPLEGRLRFLQGLDEAATGRTVAWVSLEGVGVAPAIPTLGDRRASGCSLATSSEKETVELRATETVGDRVWISSGSGPSRTSSRGRVGASLGVRQLAVGRRKSAGAPPVHGADTRGERSRMPERTGVSLVLDRNCRCSCNRPRAQEPADATDDGATHRPARHLPLPRRPAVRVTRGAGQYLAVAALAAQTQAADHAAVV